VINLDFGTRSYGFVSLKYFAIRKLFPGRGVFARGQTNKSDIAARDSKVVREDYTILTNGAEIRW